VDYEQFCGCNANDKDMWTEILEDCDRITPEELAKLRKRNIPHLLVDVRSIPEFVMCSIEGSINIPISNFDVIEITKHIREAFPQSTTPSVICICRRGNDSQHAVSKIKGKLGVPITVKDVVGGLHAWSRKVDRSFPIY